MIYTETIAPRLNRFYRGHFQNTPSIKTFFGYAGINGTSKSSNFERRGASYGTANDPFHSQRQYHDVRLLSHYKSSFDSELTKCEGAPINLVLLYKKAARFVSGIELEEAQEQPKQGITGYNSNMFFSVQLRLARPLSSSQFYAVGFNSMFGSGCFLKWENLNSTFSASYI